MNFRFPSLCARYLAIICSVFLTTAAARGQQNVPKFLFNVNYLDDTISVFRIQPLTGQLSPAPGSPFAAGRAMQGIALTPDKKFSTPLARASSPTKSINKPVPLPRLLSTH